MIAVVTDAIYPYHMGGKEVRYHHIVAGLAASGLEVHVFTMNWWNGEVHKVEDGVHYHALCRRYPLYNETRRSMVEAVMFSLACLGLFRHSFDLIEADHMPHLPLFAIRLVALVRRVPLVVTWHEYWGRAYWREYLGRLGVIAAMIEQLSLRLGDHVVTPSPTTAARLEDQGLPPSKITVIPNGLDLESIDAAKPAEQRYDLLYVGRLLAHKHVDLLIESVARLRSRGMPVTCGVVGNGPERERLEHQVHTLGLESVVTFAGNVDGQSEIFGLMKAASVFVLPSTREGFGIVVAEAIACGLPVVTTAHQDNHSRRLVEEGVTGWLCEPTTASLVGAIVNALGSHPNVRPTAERVPEHFSWRASVARILEVFELVSTREPEGTH
ncbi:MAG: glycosyltransferase family 1 protein [Acidimicrobiaceae bacterium]|nr:glycosyltransferase family 1 protein [Acidimicrobiaceae bacterium]